MILLDAIIHNALKPAYGLLPAVMNSPEASIMLLAIGLQESRFMYRAQKVVGQPGRKGPARGYWEFEEGGTRDVMFHDETKALTEWLCQRLKVAWDAQAIWAAMETNDTLAAGMARLLLWTDRPALPQEDATHEAAWQCYLRLWRPGQPERGTWDNFHQQAVDQIVHPQEFHS